MKKEKERNPGRELEYAHRLRPNDILDFLDEVNVVYDKSEVRKYMFEYACRMCEAKSIHPVKNSLLVEALMKRKLEELYNIVVGIFDRGAIEVELDLTDDCYKRLDDLVLAELNKSKKRAPQVFILTPHI